MILLIGLPLIAVSYMGLMAYREGGVSTSVQRLLAGYFIALGVLRLVLLIVGPGAVTSGRAFGGHLLQAGSMLILGGLLFTLDLGQSGATTLLAGVFAFGAVTGSWADRAAREAGRR